MFNFAPDNILSLNDKIDVMDRLLAKLHDSNTNSKLFSHLIFFFLLKRLPAAGQIDTALKILDLMRLSVSSADWSSVVSGDEDINDVRLLKYDRYQVGYHEFSFKFSLH